MTFLMMLSGRTLDPLNLTPSDIHIEDIALGLSAQKRFNGQTSRDYSVAEHSVNVATLVAMTLSEQWGFNDWRKVCENPKHRVTLRQALLHDAPEYILPALSYPIKHHPAFSFYREMEDSIWRVIAERFSVPAEMSPLVHTVDKRIATNEKLLLQGDDMPPHWGDYARKYPAFEGRFDIIDRYEVKPSLARRRFMDFYNLVREA